ncbi:MAG: hypothetical protein K8H89_10035 [Flavobacteriales bacterium]|nr:hypothetical protein [Flavobacteriales bacterium]
MARTGVATPYTSISIDDVAIHPIITADATIQPACNGQSNGSITLDVHYYDGEYDILWDGGETTAELSDLAPGDYTVTITDNTLGCASYTQTYTVLDGACSGPFTLTKTVTPPSGNTYAGAPVMFTIQACNNGATDQVVDITDQMPAGFVPAFNSPTNPYWPTASVTIPAGDCVTTEITGYFTEIGPHTNTVSLEQDPDVLLIADATVTLLQGCPMLVYGSGGCEPGNTVDLCLGMHTQLTNVESVEYYIVYPDFLEPPAPGSILGNISSPFGIASANIGTPTGLPWPSGPGYGYSTVPVNVVFNSPVNASPPYSFFCIDFTVGSIGVPTGVNAVWTWASTTPSVAGWNQVTVNMTGGSTNLWTQAYHVLFSGCPINDLPNSDFTVEASNCGGAVTVDADLTDPNAIHIWTWGDERTTPTNGAPNWTYDYFGPIIDNQGWPVNIPPAVPGTYTITHTVILNGVASTSFETVTIYECCAADLTIHDGDMASMIGTYFTGTVDIQGQFIVDENTEFDQAQVYMEAGAEIIVRPGVSLGVSYSTLESCQNRMWKTITAEHGSVVYIKESTVMDAENVLTCLDGSTAMLVRNEFRDNRNTLFVPEIVWMQWNDVSVYLNRNVFTSTGSLAQPYPGQTTSVGHVGYAAVEVYNTYADLTGGDNVIDRMSNGIIGHRSDVVVTDFGFKNVQPDAAYNYIGNGSGIFAQGDHSYNKLVQEGYGMGSAPSFENCYKGIHARYMTLWSTDNNMQNVGMPYTVERSNNRNVDILNNRLHALFNGIDLRMNDGAEHIRVQYNDITFGDVDNPWVLMPSFGIIVSEGNMGSPDSKILNNTIHFVPKYTSFLGIGLLSAAKWLVAENTLDMTNNAFNQYGIGMDGSNYNEVSCNEITGASSTAFPNDRQAAIVNFMGVSPLISCNVVDNTANGVLFNGAAYGTELRGNQFNRHRWGLHLAADALIEGQDRKGNLWYNDPPQDGWGALYENEENAQQYPFQYNPAMISGGSTQPPSWLPDWWFQNHDGPNYDCLNDHGGAYCEQFRGVNIKGLHDLDSKIAADSLENDPYTEETKLILKSGLYKKLDEDAALRDSVPDMAAFYSDLQSSTIASFKAIDDDQQVLYDMDSTVVAQLHANRVQIEGYMDLVKGQMALLDDSTLTDAQRNAIIAGISGYRQNIQTLTAWNTTAMETARSSKALTTEGIKAANANIGTTELMEANEKQVNEIYLTVIAKEVDTFTVDQTTTLFYIVNQCPMVGGNAVFKARSMYRLINDTIAFDDQQLCLPHGIIVKSLKPMDAASIVGVVPNPARNEATLMLERPLEEAGTFLVYNTVGNEVMHLVVPPEELRIPFSTRDLAPGMYHYRVMTSRGMAGQGKWSIVR